MSQRALLAAAAAVTAFVLVLFAAVLPGLSGTTAALPPTAVAAPAQVGPVAGAPPQAAPTDITQAQSAPASYAVSPDRASSIAAAGGAALAGAPELVSYQGVVAYEVPLSTGFAYVDATSGQLLAAPGADGGEHEGGEHESGEHEGGEHEGGEHDDD